jgi:hypothetical protein
MFIGADLNASEDAEGFGDYSDRWINLFAAGPPSRLSPAIRAAMVHDLHATVRDHLTHLDPRARAWGWKEPRSLILLPFLAAELPSLRFLHVVRDGRDMAYSSNQNQLARHGRRLLGDSHAGASPAARSIALWSRLNLATAEFGERVLGARYLRIRFEDLCGAPAPTVSRIFEFFGLAGDVEAIVEREVQPPAAGRWRAAAPETLGELHRVGAEGLERFGYGRDTSTGSSPCTPQS